MKTTLSGSPAMLPETAPTPCAAPDSHGQHADYWILSPADRAEGLVRPLRHAYHHTVCGLDTVMVNPIAETFARDPTFYSHTFCAHCRTHLPVAAFRWSHSDDVVGS